MIERDNVPARGGPQRELTPRLGLWKDTNEVRKARRRGEGGSGYGMEWNLGWGPLESLGAGQWVTNVTLGM